MVHQGKGSKSPKTPKASKEEVEGMETEHGHLPQPLSPPKKLSRTDHISLIKSFVSNNESALIQFTLPQPFDKSLMVTLKNTFMLQDKCRLFRYESMKKVQDQNIKQEAISGTICLDFDKEAEILILKEDSSQELQVFTQSKPHSHEVTYRALMVIEKELRKVKEPESLSVICRKCVMRSYETQGTTWETFSLKEPLQNERTCSNGHKLSNEDNQFFSGILRDFQVFDCPRNTSTPILDGAIIITCKNNPVKVQARMCLFEEFDAVCEKVGTPLGPVVEVESIEPLNCLPEGVSFQVKHFLTVPSSTEMQEEMQEDFPGHRIIKLTKQNGIFSKEVIDTFKTVDSSYFLTAKVENKHLCHITTVWNGEEWDEVAGKKERTVCTHSSLKQLALTRRKDMCSHMDLALYSFCYCKASESIFREKLAEAPEKEEVYGKDMYIDKSSQTKYSVRFKTPESVIERHVDHKLLCRYNGVVLLGAIQPKFACSCGETPCNKNKNLLLEDIEETNGIQLKNTNNDGVALQCKCYDGNALSMSRVSPLSDMRPRIDQNRCQIINAGPGSFVDNRTYGQSSTHIERSSAVSVKIRRDKEQFAKKLMEDLEKDSAPLNMKEEIMTSLRKGRDLLDVGMVLDSTCLIIVENQKNQKCGTGFLAKFNNQPDAFFVTAGHNFKDDNNKVPEPIEFDKYHLFFHNIYGISKKEDVSEAQGSKYLCLKDLNPIPQDVKLAYQYNQKTGFARNKDFFFHRVDEQVLNAQGLVCLPICTTGPQPDEAIWIFGHPADDQNDKGGAWNGSSKLRLKASEGLVKDRKEIKNEIDIQLRNPWNTTNKIESLKELGEMSSEKVFYTASTLRGHSGSPCLVCRPNSEPVWSVIGIHNGGIPDFGINFAQIMPTFEELLIQNETKHSQTAMDVQNTNLRRRLHRATECIEVEGVNTQISKLPREHHEAAELEFCLVPTQRKEVSKTNHRVKCNPNATNYLTLLLFMFIFTLISFALGCAITGRCV